MARRSTALSVPPGWYPDPDESSRFRYFDGTEWTQRLAADARGRPMAPSVRPARSRLVAVMALAATVVAVSVLAWAVVGRPPVDQSTPPALVSPLGPSYDSTGPTFAGDGRPCPVGNPTERAAHPTDDRVHGGSLSFPRLSGYRPPATDRRLTFARDVQQQALVVHANAGFETPGWAAELVVGQLRSRDGFDRTAQAAAVKLLDCLGRSPVYAELSPQIRVVLGGPWGLGEADASRSAYQLTAEILVDRPAGGYPGDLVTIAVLPDTSSDQIDWSFFLSLTPIGAAEPTEQARLTLESLRSA